MNKVKELIDQSITKVKPNCSDKERGQYQEILRKIIEKDSSLNAAVGITKEMENRYYECAHQLYSSGQYRQAGLLFAFLSTLDELNPTYFMGSAACFHMQQQYKNAANAYVAAFYLDPENPMPFYYASDCYLKDQDIGMALFSLTMVIQGCAGREEYEIIRKRAQATSDALLKNSPNGASKQVKK
jgi:type III secretion system low calcium response chaperone LcrH/SycD